MTHLENARQWMARIISDLNIVVGMIEDLEKDGKLLPLLQEWERDQSSMLKERESEFNIEFTSFEDDNVRLAAIRMIHGAPQFGACLLPDDWRIIFYWLEGFSFEEWGNIRYPGGIKYLVPSVMDSASYLLPFSFVWEYEGDERYWKNIFDAVGSDLQQLVDRRYVQKHIIWKSVTDQALAKKIKTPKKPKLILIQE